MIREPMRTWHRSPAPLLPAAVGLIVGIIIDNAVGLPLVCEIVAVLLSGVAVAVFHRHRLIVPLAVAVVAMALGAAMHDRAYRRVAADHILRCTSDEPTLACLTGVLLGDPVVYDRSGGHFASWIYGRRRTTFLVDAERIMSPDGPVDVSGEVRVYVKEPVMDLRSGDRVRLIGEIYRPFGPSNPGQFDWALRSRRQGIWTAMSCKLAASVTRIDTSVRRKASLRRRLRDVLRRWLRQDVWASDETASVLDAIVLGQRGGISQEIDEAFIKTGTAHFLCVSGTHVGMLAIVVWWLIRSSGVGRASGAAVVLVVVGVYVLVADPRVPILRAGILCALGCVAVGIRRRTSPLNWLSAGALVILVWRPCDVFSAGFQLSFGVVLGILLLSRPIRSSLMWIRQRIRAWFIWG